MNSTCESHRRISRQRSKTQSSGGKIQGIKDGVRPSDTGWRCHRVIKDRLKWIPGVSGANDVEAVLKGSTRSGWTKHRWISILCGRWWRIPDPPLYIWCVQLHYASQRSSASAEWAIHRVSCDQGLIEGGRLRLVEVPVGNRRENKCVCS